MKHIFSLLLCAALTFLLSVSSYAAYDDSEDIVEDDSYSWLDSLPSPDELPITTRAPEPEQVPSTDSSDEVQASSDVGIMPLDNTFGGAWDGSVLSYFEGFVLNHFTDHYVAFRGAQNVYYLYVGNISYDNGRYVGDNLIVVTYSVNYQSNEYVTVGTGSLNQFVDGVYYSDLEGGSAFVSQKICFILLCLGVLCAVFNLARLFHSFFSRS